MLCWVLDAIPSRSINPDPNTGMLRKGEWSRPDALFLISSLAATLTASMDTMVAEKNHSISL